MFMLEIITLLAALAGAVLLVALALYDVRTHILPNELVLGLTAAGLVFHLSTFWAYIPPSNMLLGTAIGGGSLFLIYLAGEYVLRRETMGLGDVKLMAACGIWLGVEGTLLGLTLGSALAALSGLLPVMRHVSVEQEELHKAEKDMVPAGPGLAIGCLLTGIWQFWLQDTIPLPF